MSAVRPTLTDYQIHGTTDFVIVYADSLYENKLEITGEHGQKVVLDRDGEIDQKKHRCWGITVAIPQKLSADRTIFAIDKKPIKINEIQPDVNLGEKVYFSYLALSESSELPGYPNHYFIPYNDIIATVRGSQIIPIGSHLLLDLVYPEGTVKVEGNVMAKVNSFGMVTELDVKPKPFEAIVKYVGLPLKNHEYGIEAGQHVGLEKFAWGTYSNADGFWKHAGLYTIEGTDYLVSKQHNVAWIYE